jgi:uncharacterized damage-inducible protein DinB
MKNELDLFKEIWERESDKTLKLFQSLPADGYDFRPDPDGRSLGEMAWHIAEGEGYGTFGIERGALTPGDKPAGIERPRTVPELATGFARVHADAVARVAKLTPEDLDRPVTVFGPTPNPIRNVLWDFILMHGIHHRGQLAMLARQSGGTPSSTYGPTRETMPLRKPA